MNLKSTFKLFTSTGVWVETRRWTFSGWSGLWGFSRGKTRTSHRHTGSLHPEGSQIGQGKLSYVSCEYPFASIVDLSKEYFNFPKFSYLLRLELYLPKLRTYETKFHN